VPILSFEKDTSKVFNVSMKSEKTLYSGFNDFVAFPLKQQWRIRHFRASGLKTNDVMSHCVIGIKALFVLNFDFFKYCLVKNGTVAFASTVYSD